MTSPDFLNPDYLSVAAKQEIGLWPDYNIAAVSMMPYIKRLNKDGLIKILLVGDVKGENSYHINDIITYEQLVVVDIGNREGVFGENVSKIKKIRIIKNPTGLFDFVYINSNLLIKDIFSKYYDLLRPNGIICGDQHEKPSVKENLRAIRRELRIGTPIDLANRTIWFWHRR
jgi:SAM-dependent methyltransferase